MRVARVDGGTAHTRLVTRGLTREGLQYVCWAGWLAGWLLLLVLLSSCQFNSCRGGILGVNILISQTRRRAASLLHAQSYPSAKDRQRTANHPHGPAATANARELVMFLSREISLKDLVYHNGVDRGADRSLAPLQNTAFPPLSNTFHVERQPHLHSSTYPRHGLALSEKPGLSMHHSTDQGEANRPVRLLLDAYPHPRLA